MYPGVKGPSPDLPDDPEVLRETHPEQTVQLFLFTEGHPEVGPHHLLGGCHSVAAVSASTVFLSLLSMSLGFALFPSPHCP